jgi:23S rRNA pseudouridine955/2504/2580 synthase
LPLIHRLLRQKQVLINGKPGKAQDRIDCGAIISIPALNDASVHNNTIHSLPNPEIIWEGCGLLAVNKPPGLAVHGVDSLDAMVQSFLAGKLPVSLSFKSGPLHRLDKPSSGIVVFSASLEGARLFTSLMIERKIKKTYLAIVEGAVKNEETWQDNLVRDREKKKTFISQTADAKTAITKVIPKAVEKAYSLIQAEIVTGRTHQIRAQAAAHGHPLIGDFKYGSKSKKQTADFYLHAWKLEFLEYSIEAPLPQAFREKITALFTVNSNCNLI